MANRRTVVAHLDTPRRIAALAVDRVRSFEASFNVRRPVHIRDGRCPTDSGRHASVGGRRTYTLEMRTRDGECRCISGLTVLTNPQLAPTPLVRSEGFAQEKKLPRVSPMRSEPSPLSATFLGRRVARFFIE